MMTDHHLAEKAQVEDITRCYFLGKLRFATNGMLAAVGNYMIGPFPSEGTLNPDPILHRHVNPSDDWIQALAPVDGADASLTYSYNIMNALEAHKIHNLEGGGTTVAIWVAGLKGLLSAVEGNYKAAKDLLCHCVFNIADQADLGSDFFHEYVVSLFAEALGYLLTHVMDFRVPILDCYDSDPGNCQNVHAIYPFFLQQLGLLQEEGAQVQYTEDIFGSLLEFARLNPCWPEASCACFHSYYRAAMAAIDQDVMKARTVMLEGIREANMTARECSLWKALGEMECECRNFRQALKAYSVALQGRLNGPDPEALLVNNISTQFLCQRIMELVPLAGSTLPTHLQAGPATDADPVDFLAFALSFLSLSETPDVQMILWQQVADLVAVKQQNYPWISYALMQLDLGYRRAGAYNRAAEARILHSRMSSVYDRADQLSSLMQHLYKAGELGKALEIVEEQIIPMFAELDESDWELQAQLHICAASYFSLAGRSDEAFALRQVAVDLASCRGINSSEYKLHKNLLQGIVSLLQDYRHRKSWPLADKLVNTFDAQIHKHFSGTAKWKQWQMVKANIAHELGEYEHASTILQEVIDILEDRADPAPELQHHLLLLRIIANQNANAGNWKMVLKKTQQILKELTKLPPCLRIKHIEMRAHILSAQAFNQIAGEKGKAEIEIDKVVKLYNTWSMSGELAGDDHNRYARLFAEDLAAAHVVKALMALEMDHEVEKALKLLQDAESLVSSAGNISITLANVKYVQALVRQKQRQWTAAVKLAREAVIMVTILQRRLCSLDPEAPVWNAFFRMNMQEKFWLLQNLYVDLKQPERGLLWAERSNMRCFLHQINSKPDLELEPLFDVEDLDECDTLLQSVVLITARSLSPTTAIIYYSYNPTKSVIFMYVVKYSPSTTATSCNVREKIAVQVVVKVCDLPTWFTNAGLPHTTRLEAVIKKARTNIQNGADKKAIKDLCTLHSLLIEFIDEDLQNYDTLVIAPGHGCLSSVPFAALNDRRTGKFLVESKAIALIPSIVILHHCLHRQLKFELNNQLPVPQLEDVSYTSSFMSCNPNAIEFHSSKWVPNPVAFIAGNPEPMGLGLPHLENARFEVSLVASYFDVQPCLGRNMTKKAVLEGLTSSSVVLLATHGIVDDWYPYGCLVMKGSSKDRTAPADKESCAATLITISDVKGEVLLSEGCGSGGGEREHAPESSAATLRISKGKGKLFSEGCKAGGGEEEQASSSNNWMYGDVMVESSACESALGDEGTESELVRDVRKIYGDEQAGSVLANKEATSLTAIFKGKCKLFPELGCGAGGEEEQVAASRRNSKYGDGSDRISIRKPTSIIISEVNVSEGYGAAGADQEAKASEGFREGGGGKEEQTLEGGAELADKESYGAADQQASNNSEYGNYGAEGVRSGHRIFQHTDERSKRRKKEEEEEVLTAAEIAGLEGGISAGMVVLSACESGLGEATEGEGVLGLGRAVLQGGAACALLTLWKVLDGCNMALITGLFHCAFIDPLSRGKTVCECLQLMMKGSIQCGGSIQTWASLQLMGSPVLRLSLHDMKQKGASWMDECAFVLFNSLHGARCPLGCGVCERHFEAEDSHGLPDALESFPVHPHIGRLVKKYGRAALDQLPPLQDKHVLIKFPDDDSLPVAFIVKPDGNVRQVVHKHRKGASLEAH